MILRHAAEVIAAEGVSGLSMERLGRAAGISKSLIYSYFPTLNDLLWALLEREYTDLRKLQTEAADSAETIEQMVRRVTRVYLKYIEDRGMLMEMLASQPAVTQYGDPTTYARQPAVEYFTDTISKTFGIDPSIAAPAIDISFGLPAAAGKYLIHHDTDRQTIEDITVAMILGAVEALSKTHAISLKPLKR